MSALEAATAIIAALVANGSEADVYTSWADISDQLENAGIDRNDIDAGLTYAVSHGWLQRLETLIAFTTKAEQLFGDSPQNGPFH